MDADLELHLWNVTYTNVGEVAFCETMNKIRPDMYNARNPTRLSNWTNTTTTMVELTADEALILKLLAGVTIEKLE